jgi:hypothetical protein
MKSSGRATAARQSVPAQYVSSFGPIASVAGMKARFDTAIDDESYLLDRY